MDYQKFSSILNRHIFDRDKIDLLDKIANNPKRYTGLFRPTKPKTKIFQNLLQSHEIRFGDALETIVEEILFDLGYEVLEKKINTKDNNSLEIDQLFTDGVKVYFVEQKVRDDHDSTKKRGQVDNFEKKLTNLYDMYGDRLEGMMYFIDPSLTKNKNYYSEKLIEIGNLYRIQVMLFYGVEFFEYLGKPNIWNNLLIWLNDWKDGLPDFPEANLDINPVDSFNQIKDIDLQVWRKLLNNEQIWDEGIMQVLFVSGDTLRLLQEHFTNSSKAAYRHVGQLLERMIQKYYE